MSAEIAQVSDNEDSCRNRTIEESIINLQETNYSKRRRPFVEVRLVKKPKKNLSPDNVTNKEITPPLPPLSEKCKTVAVIEDLKPLPFVKVKLVKKYLTASIVNILSTSQIENCLRQFRFSNLLGLSHSQKQAFIRRLQIKNNLTNECIKAAAFGFYEIIKIEDHKLANSLDLSFYCKVNGVVQLQWLLKNKESEHLNFNEAIDLYVSNIKTDYDSLYRNTLKSHLIRVSNPISRLNSGKWYNLVFKINERYRPFLKEESWVSRYDLVNK